MLLSRAEPTPPVTSAPLHRRESFPVLAAAFLFNVGQGVLRPSMPLYLQQSLAANYRIVTAIPTVFGAGKWAASLPTGYLLDRVGRRRLMALGLLMIAGCDVASIAVSTWIVFLGIRGLAGAGWAMFATAATTIVIDAPLAHARGRAVSRLAMSETAGLLLGSLIGGWLYETLGRITPFIFEAGCMAAAAIVVGRGAPTVTGRPAAARSRSLVGAVLRIPGVIRISLTNAALVVVQTGVLVFLLPLFLAGRVQLDPSAVGFVVALNVVGRLLALWLAGGISDRLGRAAVLLPGLIGYGLLLGSIGFFTSPVAVGGWSVAIGFAAGIVTVLPAALLGDIVPPELRGLAVGWLRTIADTAQIVGPLAMGALADGVDLTAPFVASAALLLVVAWWCRGLRTTSPAGAS